MPNPFLSFKTRLIIVRKTCKIVWLNVLRQLTRRIMWLTLISKKTSFEKNCFSAWASTLNMGLINKVDMVCLLPVGYGV